MRVTSLLAVALLSACSPPLTVEDAGLTGGSGGGAAGAGGGGGGGSGGGGQVVDAGVPEKFVFLFEASPSLPVTDPLASRVAGLQSALEALPNDPRISVAVMAFAGNTLAIFNDSGLMEFTPVPQLTPASRATMLTRLTNFTPPGTGPFARDWVFALSSLYDFLYRDTMRALTFGEPLARYTLFFITDGAPSANQDDELLCGGAVTRIGSLAASALDVRLHTVHVFMPSQPVMPTCTQDAGVVAGAGCALPTVTLPVCPILQVDLDAERLRRMAVLGHGRAVDARSAPVQFGPLFQ